MYQFRKIASQANITLPKQATPPTYSDLENLVARALQNRGRYVELPFGDEATSGVFVLTIKHIADAGEPIWTLYRGEGSQSVLVWSHATHDLALMHGLILSELSGGLVTESSHVDKTFTSAALAQQASEKTVTAGPEAAAAEPMPAQSEPVETAPAQQSTVEEAPRTVPQVAEKRLEGNLRNIKMPKLLEHIAENQLTGRLALQGGMGAAEVFFAAGAPQHASSLENQGEAALFEIVTWDEGEFIFHHNEQTSQKSVTKYLEKILAEASDLYDRSRFLAAAGLNQDSTLIRCADELSAVDIDMLTANSASLDSQGVRSLLESLDGRHTLGDILRKRPMVRSEWISLFYNFLKYGMVTLAHTAPIPTIKLDPMEVDEERIRSALATLTDPESGIVTYSAFLYFLQQEFFRYERVGGRFSLIVLGIGMREGDSAPASPLPKPALREFGRYISTVKRKLDLFAHFEEPDLVLLMPDTDSAGASVLASRIAESLNKLTENAAAANVKLEMAFGSACLPDDCREPGTLMAAAREAKRRAKDTDSRVLMFADIGRL